MCLCFVCQYRNIVDKKCFWKTLKRHRYKETITLIKNNEIYELKVVQTFNNYFVDILPLLKINYNKDFLTDTDNQENPIQVILEKSKNQSSILVINNKNANKA